MIEITRPAVASPFFSFDIPIEENMIPNILKIKNGNENNPSILRINPVTLNVFFVFV